MGEGWQFQQTSTDEQSFYALPFDVMPLSVVGEGNQFEFLN
jgi:hypothetical protein